VVHFVGAGSGAPDLITLRGARLLGEADVVIYAGSLVNPELLTLTKPGCEVHDSAKLTLEEVIALIERAEREGKTTVRLHTGDPSIYGAVREQFAALTERGIDFDVCPGVSSFCGAAAALRAEYTLPNVSQEVWMGKDKYLMQVVPVGKGPFRINYLGNNKGEVKITANHKLIRA
jgi:precorrin-4/cobalt-precorrin-4 C11-methyltransferase